MTKYWMIALPALALAGCGSEAPKEEAKAETPKTFPTGEWEVTSTVDDLKSTDKTTPIVKVAKGATATRKACITDAKALESLFVATGDTCKVQTAYARNGSINSAWTCKRGGVGGSINPTVYGKYTADSFEATVNTGTLLSGSGDYLLTEKLQGKRLGDCTAAAGDEKKAG